jgi:hypothetical protein
LIVLANYLIVNLPQKFEMMSLKIYDVGGFFVTL